MKTLLLEYRSLFKSKFLKYSFFAICIVGMIYPGNATNYYLSSSGNDNNSGITEKLSWKSLDKVNKFDLIPGDQILFKRGDTWRGTVAIRASGTEENPIVYGAYGIGKNPAIYGSEEITGWSRHDGHIYKTHVSTAIGQLFINGKRIRAARYPNEGYVFIDSTDCNIRFSSDELHASIDYTGAKWFGRTIYWLGVLKDIVASSSKTLTLDSAPEQDLGQNEGFFLMNKLEFLDQAGEWYYDNQTNMVYIWTPNGDAPANYTVTGSVYSNGFYLKGVDYVVINDFDLKEQNENEILTVNTNDIVPKNNTIFSIERYGIFAEKGSSHTVANNKVTHANALGILLSINHSHIFGNTIDSRAVFSEIGLKGTTRTNGGSGAEINGDGNIIEYNVIENSNYNGLFYRGVSIIQYNYIKNSCLVKDDGGDIYTNTSGSNGIVRYNIIVNSVGNPEGYIGGRSLANGIYIDEIASNVMVEHNTVVNTGSAGIFLHNVENVQVSHNTIISARYGLQLNVYAGTVPSKLKNNLVYLTSDSDDYEPRQLLVRVGTYKAVLDSNIYVDPYNSSGIFRTNWYLDYTQWQVAEKQDTHSTFKGAPLAAGETYKIFYNKTKSTTTHQLNDAVARDVYGEEFSADFMLEPYTSIILIGSNLDQIAEMH